MEILTRLKFEGHTPPVQVNTFHSWAIRFLQHREIRELTQRQRVTVWDNKEQRAQMGDAIQRTLIDYNLLPAARKCLDLPSTGYESPLESWADLLNAAFSHDTLKKPLTAAKERARERVSEVLKELSVPEAAGDEEDVAQSGPKEQTVQQKNIAAELSHSAADYGSLRYNMRFPAHASAATFNWLYLLAVSSALLLHHHYAWVHNIVRTQHSPLPVTRCSIYIEAWQAYITLHCISCHANHLGYLRGHTSRAPTICLQPSTHLLQTVPQSSLQPILQIQRICLAADEVTAAPGAAQLPAARIKHVAAKHKRSTEGVNAGNVDSEDKDPGLSHQLDERKADGHWVEAFFAEEADSDVGTWTLVAKELLTVRFCLLLLHICCPPACSEILILHGALRYHMFKFQCTLST